MAELFSDYAGLCDDERPSPEDYLELSDAELKEATSAARGAKIKSIRNWPRPLSGKQRFCLAAWLAEAEERSLTRARCWL